MAQAATAMQYWLHAQLRPSRIPLAGLHHGFNEGHAANAILDLWIISFRSLRRALIETRANAAGEVFVNVRERFQVTFRVRGRGAGRPRRVGAEVTVARAEDLHWLIEPLHQQRV